MVNVTISKILEEMNVENGSNYKTTVVKKHLDNELFRRVIVMCYDRVKYTYYTTMKNVHAGSSENTKELSWGLDQLEKLSRREVTGNTAILLVEDILESMSESNRDVIVKILGRDLKVNYGKTLFNKLLPKDEKITKPPYERCDIGTEKNVKKNINFKEKVYSEVKMDGTYRSCTLDGDNLTIMSRSGQEDSFEYIEKEIKSLEIDGYTFIGEMTLKGEQNRSKGNGIINSITEREEKQDQILYTIWDMIPNSEYSMTKDEIKAAEKAGTLSKYEDRLNILEALLKDKNFKNVELIEYRIIKSMKEAYEHFQEVTKRDDEGTVIKASDMTWKDGTSKKQLKCKLVIDAEVKCVGFIEGTPGTKREKTFGSLVFENDEGTIKGSTSGFTDDQLEEINNDRDKYIGKIFTVEFNDITKAKNSDYFAFSHPRFVEFRDDKDTTDTLERCLEMKEMAMNVS